MLDLRLVAMLMILAVFCATGHAKSGRRYYTEQRLGWMRKNLEKHDWARQERDKIISRADRWVKYEDEQLVDLVPPLEVARCNDLHGTGCPVHGMEILKYRGGRRRAWRMSFDKMYKIQCPVGGEWYPSNDFHAYLKSGCKDKSLLVGEYVDDGWGCKVPGHDKRFWFVGFAAGEMVRRWLLPAINDMSQAYLLTGDEEYAHKTALLLWQIAHYYPDYSYETQSRYGLEFEHNYYGRLQYHTWECFTIQDVSVAYDAVYPAIERDEALEQFTGKSADEIEADIEDRLLRVAAKDITDGSRRIQGNFGMHQSALLRTALVLDTDEGEQTSQDMVDWVMKGPEKVTVYTDTPVPDAIVNLFHRDGVPFESPSYNCAWMENLEDVAELLLLNGVDIWDEPRFQGLYLWPLKMLVCGTMTQPMGDSNTLAAMPLGVIPKYLERALQRIGDPRVAVCMVQSERQFRRDLFQESMEEEAREVAGEYEEPAGVESALLPGLGYATLQTGNERSRSAIALYYGYYKAHAHLERLNLELYSYGRPLLPDLGYPEIADSFEPRRFGWLSHTAAHNTVMVDATRQDWGTGELVAYHRDGWAQMVEARALSAYPDKQLGDFRRAIFLIDMSEDRAYCLDMFHVAGGKQHDWLIHGNEGDFSAEGINLSPPRAKGTLAGPDVAYGEFYDDPELIDGPGELGYYTYKGSAFQWLFNVQQAPLDGTGIVRWDLSCNPKLYPYKPTTGIGLRVHILGQDETVYACDGVPPRGKNLPEKLKWVVRRRTGENLDSTFASVFEPFDGSTPQILEVKAVEVRPADGSAVVHIEHATGTDMIFWTPKAETEHSFGGYTVRGRAACIRLDEAGKLAAARLIDGTSLSGPGVSHISRGPVSTRIAEIDHQKNLVTLDEPVLRQADVAKWAPVSTGQYQDAVRIDAVIEPRTFSLGTQDLRCGIGNVLSMPEANLIEGDRVLHFCHPGMQVLNEDYVPVGRVAGIEGTNVRLAEHKVNEDAFADSDKDGRARFIIVALGSGDVITIPARSDADIEQ